MQARPFLSTTQTFATTALAAVAVALLAACAPALDWRDVQPAGTALRVQFPCRPIQQQRQVELAGSTVTLRLAVCDADGQTWGLAHADVVDPARVAPALEQLRSAAAANVGAASAADIGASQPAMQVPGATPNPASQRARLQGRLPDGKPVQMQLVVFGHGTRVFQATVLGAQVPAAGADSYFASLAIRP